MTENSTSTWTTLPSVVTTYLTAHEARDVSTAIGSFTADLHYRFTLDGDAISRLVVEP